MDTINIYRGATLVAAIPPDANSVQSKQVMGDNVLSLSFVLPAFVAFNYGDSATVFGELYKINQQPQVNKLSGRWEYTLTMQAEYFDLTKVQFLNLGIDNTLREITFPFTGTLSKFLDLLLLNANRISPTWKKGDVISTGPRTMSFSMENCFQALQRCADEFNTEWWIEGKTIHLSPRRTASYLRFRHGRNKGLYTITRMPTANTRIVTRLYAVGSEKNLPPNYRNGQQRLKMLGGVDFIEENVDKYGVIEDSMVFEDIYPHRTGKVTAVGDIYTFYDSTLNFDINQYLLPGIEPKITFNTGQLAGYTFKVQAYNPTTKEFRILKNTEEKALDVPSDLLKAALNDEYVLTDIYLPQAYITEPERQLTVAASVALSKMSRPQFSYAVDIDPLYMQRRGYTLDIGAEIPVTDADFAFDERLPVVKLTRNIQSEWKYTVELAARRQIGPIQQLQTNQQATDRNVRSVGRSLANLPINNNNVVGDLNIRDGSIVFDNLPPLDGDPSLYQTLFLNRFTRKLHRG